MPESSFVGIPRVHEVISAHTAEDLATSKVAGWGSVRWGNADADTAKAWELWLKSCRIQFCAGIARIGFIRLKGCNRKREATI